MSAPISQNPPVLSRKQVVWTMAGVMLAILLSSLDQTVVGTAMPRIVAELGGFSQYTWVTSIYMITSAVTIPIVGKLTDMYGRKIFYLIGIAIFVLFSLACGLSQNMTQLIIFRGLQGIGAGVMMANAFTVIGDLFAPAERGKYQGFVAAVFGFSSVIGPTIGGYLTDQVSWHWVFFVNIPLGILVIALFIKFFPNIRADNLKHRIDYPGLTVLILTVVPAMLALSWGGVQYAWGSPQIIAMFVFAGLMLALFLFLETRAGEPIIPLSIFKNNIVAISNIVTFLTSMGMFGAITFVPLYYQGILGASATASGNMMIPMSMTVTVASFAAGQILSRSGGRYKLLGILGTAFICAGLFLLSRLSVDTPYWHVIVAIMFVGLGMGATMPVFTIAIQNAVPYNQLGVATSSNTFVRSFGGAVGLAILGSIMNNRFFGGFIGGIPENIKSAVPMDELSALAHNPQALVNPAAQDQLKEMLSRGGAGSAIFDQLMALLREALSSAITRAFLIGFCFLVLALIAAFFLKEIPLRKTNHPINPAQPVGPVSPVRHKQ
jgi:EmrB/QacA subfamily drug resistance transporter